MDGNQKVIGDGSTDIVIKTRGKIWIQVGDHRYELKFK